MTQDPFHIVFQDDHVVVVDKPSGLLSVPGRTPDLQDCLWNRLREEFPEREVLLVHRLDRDTSGLIVFAHTHDAQVGLGRQFEKRRVQKAYLAWVHGVMEPEEGTVEGLIRKDWSRVDKPVYVMDPERGRTSLTRFEVVRRGEDRTLVRLIPHTGRSHQLRVHMQSLGHPIVGDPIYGPDGDAPPLLLAAVELAFAHPISGEPMSFRIDPPDYF
jgi:tRNA pseudouridine32 synthase/23S rRNA pseudouridine746 synthase